MKSFYLLFTLILFSSILFAQTADFDLNDFIIAGDARRSGQDCIILTENLLWQGGSAWFKSPINLNAPFAMELELDFGCDDEGADGMVFIFHPTLSNGYRGEGMGFGGLYPSFGIEMDTYENPHLADPWYDHLAVMKHGTVHHHGGITRPVSLLPQNKDIEDCGPHQVKISWDPQKQNLKVLIDGSTRLDTRYDIIEKIFSGDPMVYWGISSATGGKRNRHQICLEKLEFSTPVLFTKAIRELLLAGQTYTLQDVEFRPGTTALQAPSFRELDRLIALLKANSNLDVHISGHTDSSGSEAQNKSLSQKRADEVAEYLLKNGISKKRIKSTGYGEQFPKVDNNTPQNRKINRRIDVILVDPRA